MLFLISAFIRLKVVKVLRFYETLKDFTLLAISYRKKFGLGPIVMINNVNHLATEKHNGDITSFVRVFEFFFFFLHLSEAAGFYPVEFYICKTLNTFGC